MLKDIDQTMLAEFERILNQDEIEARKKVLKQKAKELELKAEHYSRTDWIRFGMIMKELGEINDEYLKLMVPDENESFVVVVA